MRVRVKKPEHLHCSHAILFSGRQVAIGEDRMIEVSEEDALPPRNGWTKVENR